MSQKKLSFLNFFPVWPSAKMCPHPAIMLKVARHPGTPIHENLKGIVNDFLVSFQTNKQNKLFSKLIFLIVFFIVL